MLAMDGHERLQEVVAAAEARGVAVAVHADGLSGAIFYSPGGGQPYRIVRKSEYRSLRNRSGDGPSGLLSIQANAHGDNWKAVRTVGGLLHGDTADLPAVCASRMGYKGTEVSEALMREGARVESDADPAFRPL